MVTSSWFNLKICKLSVLHCQCLQAYFNEDNLIIMRWIKKEVFLKKKNPMCNFYFTDINIDISNYVNLYTYLFAVTLSLQSLRMR